MIRDHVLISVISGTECSEYDPGIRDLASCGFESEVVSGPITPECIGSNTLAVVDYRTPHPLPFLGRDRQVSYVLDTSTIRMLLRSADFVPIHTSIQCFDKLREGLEAIAKAPVWPFEFAQAISRAYRALCSFEGQQTILEQLDRKFAKNNALYLNVLDAYTRPLKDVCEIARSKPELIGQLDGHKRHHFEVRLQTCREALSAANELRNRSA